MKQISFILLLILCFSCSGGKELKLPEIKHSKITEITEVSPAYIFYNTSEKDSIELNKQNLISTTNWLVNVDKRLTLQQVMPVLIDLQNKKRDAAHKKKGVKNYYTAFNPEVKNLCFIEFTNLNYHIEDTVEAYLEETGDQAEIVTIGVQGVRFQNKNYTMEAFIDQLNSEPNERHIFILNFENQLTFQEYMSIKDLLLTIKVASVLINTNEFIFQS